MNALLSILLAFTIVGDVRKAAMSGDLAGGERLVEQQRKQSGMTPELLEAYSWLGRGALAAKNYDAAERYAAETKKYALEMLRSRQLDDERHLPIALGAAIEVHGQLLAAGGDRAAALEYLHGELEQYRETSIRTRIQKNVNLIGLEGKPAPRLEGVQLEKKPTLLFFWAHWCGDCKAQAPVLARIQQEFPALKLVAPTQLYGYALRGREVEPEQERKHIEGVRQQFYSGVRDMRGPVNEENFKVYGVSTTPTLVLVDGNGIVRMYHPGLMTYEELAPQVAQLLRQGTT